MKYVAIDDDELFRKVFALNDKWCSRKTTMWEEVAVFFQISTATARNRADRIGIRKKKSQAPCFRN